MRYFFCCSIIVALLPSCYVARAFKFRNFKLTDHERLPSQPLRPAAVSYQFFNATTAPEYERFRSYLDTNLTGTYTAAFLVIRNDSIIYERYFDGFSQNSLLPSFSVAKSFVSTLIAIAIDEGKITSVNDPITKYLPELSKHDKNFSRITLQHLLDMRSGLEFNEGSYGLKDDAIRLGFRPNLRRHALKVKIKKEPGGKFEYQSINTELLALALEKATGKKIVSYLEDKLWQPMGAEYKATWNVDSKKHKQEIAFAGLNATARDFAKLGRLYLNDGYWQNKQLLQAHWVKAVNNSDSMSRAEGYKNQFWSKYSYRFFKDSTEAVAFRNSKSHASSVQKTSGYYRVAYRSNAFLAEGILNQYVYINPDNHVIIVRLGHNWNHRNFYPDQFIYTVGERL
jgi:CubicO group peptidase (beta-lactamase class C family)